MVVRDCGSCLQFVIPTLEDDARGHDRNPHRRLVGDHNDCYLGSIEYSENGTWTILRRFWVLVLDHG